MPVIHCASTKKIEFVPNVILFGRLVLATWLKQLRDEFTDLLFPRICVGCGSAGEFICANCSRKMVRILPPICRRCGRPESSGTYCSECWNDRSSLDCIRSVFIFDGIVRTAVHACKYQDIRAIAVFLAGYMSAYCIEQGLNADIVVPLPLHENRLRQRGYNQAEFLAREISRGLQVPVKTAVVKRVHNNLPQVRTRSVEERFSNIAGAFACEPGVVDGLDVMLVDDVCTTGATLESCASALKEGGASRVSALTLAREILKRSS